MGLSCFLRVWWGFFGIFEAARDLPSRFGILRFSLPGFSFEA